jgi:hypothetical protein
VQHEHGWQFKWAGKSPGLAWRLQKWKEVERLRSYLKS